MQEMNKIIPELLAPAKDPDKLKTALRYGADAVYIGGKSFSLRSRASNFDLNEIFTALNYAHARGKKLYVTVNIIFHDADLYGIKAYLKKLDEIGIDAIIVESLALVSICKAEGYNFECHLSTQFSSLNSSGINYLSKYGVDRVVLAREADLAEIALIKKRTSMPLEIFIHGGMCANISGHCTLSNWLVNRDANRGGCAQPCRWHYYLYKDNQKVNFKYDLFSMGSKDLMALKALKRLTEIGVASLKIEGRMKTDYYIATVVRAYRAYLDALSRGEDPAIEPYIEELSKAENRPFSDGFFFNMNEDKQLYRESRDVRHDYVAEVLAYDINKKEALVETHNPLALGDELEAFGPKLANIHFKLEKIIDRDGQELYASRSPMQKIIINAPVVLEKHDMLRKVI